MTKQPSFSTIKALVIDMDGVLWRGDSPLPGLSALFAFMRRDNIPFTLATNNASKTQAQYVAKLGKLGVAISEDEVMTSSLATAAYLKQTFKPGAKIHIVGQDGIRQAVAEAGFEIADEDAQAVVVGLDFELTYGKLKTATVLINRGAKFIGTNPDKTFPFEGGVAPGNGAILAALTAATGQQPKIIGKPGRVMFDIAIQRMNVDPAHTAMLGDRLETDILGGQRAGLKTMLLLSGITQPADLKASNIKPDWVFGGIDSLVKVWQNG